MRITNSMMVQTMIRNLNRNMVRLNDKQIQFSTGKRINKPSDDPLGISKSLRLRTDISVMEQYGKNVNDAYSFMDNTETALQNMLEGMQRIRELTVQAASATLTQEETSKMQAEIGEIRNQLTDLANYTYSGKNIFTGKKTSEALLDRDGNYLVDLTKATDPRMIDDKWAFEVSTRETIQVNTLGFEVFEAETREVVYTEMPDPIANWAIELPLKEGNGNFVLNVRQGNADAPAKDSVTGEWSVGADWEADVTDPLNPIPLASDELVTKALEEIQETVGPQLGEYTFELMDPIRETELIDSNDPSLGYQLTDPITYLRAIPLNATIADNYEMQAAWNSGTIGTIDYTDADFLAGVPQTLTFSGVEISVVLGEGIDSPASPDLVIPHPIPDSNKVTITVRPEVSADDPPAYTWPTPVEFAAAYTDALNQLAAQRGSEVFGFNFSPDGAGGIQAVAPERSGSLHNKAFFGGTIGVGTPRASQLVVEGTSPTLSVKAGQKAGLFDMLDKLEDNLLAGRQEDLSNMLGRIDAHINSILTVRSEVGAKSNRMELITNRIEDDTLNFRDLMSKIEDADMSKVIIELMNEENVYRSALGVGARIIQPTLLDFLR